MWHAWERTDTHAQFWWDNLKERGRLEDLRAIGQIKIKLISKIQKEMTWTGFLGIRMKIIGGPL